VSKEEGQSFADKHKMPFIEVSASTGTNIQELFDVRIWFHVLMCRQLQFPYMILIKSIQTETKQ